MMSQEEAEDEEHGKTPKIQKELKGAKANAAKNNLKMDSFFKKK